MSVSAVPNPPYEEELAPIGLDRVKDRLLDMVREAQRRRGVTQAELANRLGISQPAVSMMLARDRAGREIPTDRLIRLLNIMGFDFELCPTETERDGAIQLGSPIPIFERLNMPSWVVADAHKSSLTLVMGPNAARCHEIMLSMVSYLNRNDNRVAWTIERKFTQFIPNASQTSLEIVHQTYEESIDFICRQHAAKL